MILWLGVTRINIVIDLSPAILSRRWSPDLRHVCRFVYPRYLCARLALQCVSLSRANYSCAAQKPRLVWGFCYLVNADSFCPCLNVIFCPWLAYPPSTPLLSVFSHIFLYSLRPLWYLYSHFSARTFWYSKTTHCCHSPFTKGARGICITAYSLALFSIFWSGINQMTATNANSKMEIIG